jgi:hypothetical protein
MVHFIQIEEMIFNLYEFHQAICSASIQWGLRRLLKSRKPLHPERITVRDRASSYL